MGVISLYFTLVSARDVHSVCNSGMSTRRELTVSKIYGSIFCVFQKHVNSEVKIIWMPSIVITTTTTNEPWERKQTNRSKSTNRSPHSWLFTPLEQTSTSLFAWEIRLDGWPGTTRKSWQNQLSRVVEGPSAVIMNRKQFFFMFYKKIHSTKYI